MYSRFSLIFLSVYLTNGITLFPNKQTGLGEPCSNRNWITMSSWVDLPKRVEALQYKKSSLPFFNDSVYLAGVYNRVKSDQMLKALTWPLRSLVLVECLEYQGEFIQTIENYLNNIVSAKSWASNAHDLSFDYFYGRAYWVELFSGNLITFTSSCF